MIPRPLNGGLTREQVLEVQDRLSKYEPLIFETNHFFSPSGMYCRTLKVPKGAMIIGKEHKTDNFFMLASGYMLVYNEDSETVLGAGSVVNTHKGDKRVGIALTDCICMNVFKTKETDMVKLEEELAVEDSAALYGPGNVLKTKELPCV